MLSLKNPKTEVRIIYSGLIIFTLLYYTRNLLLSVLGVIILLSTAVYWAIAIRIYNPLSLRDLRVISQHWLIYVVVGTSLGLLGWGYEHIISRISTGYWLSLDFKAPLFLILSIITVVMAEEVVFNGYILTRLNLFSKSRVLRAFLAVLALALYKVMIHLWDGLPIDYYVWLFINEIFLSLLMAWYADYTGSLVAPFASHLVWDLLMYGTQNAIPYWVF